MRQNRKGLTVNGLLPKRKFEFPAISSGRSSIVNEMFIFIRSLIPLQAAVNTQFILTGSAKLFDKSTLCSRHYQNSTLALRLEPFALSLFCKDRSNELGVEERRIIPDILRPG
jgi:hypothetical protein